MRLSTDMAAIKVALWVWNNSAAGLEQLVSGVWYGKDDKKYF